MDKQSKELLLSSAYLKRTKNDVNHILFLFSYEYGCIVHLPIIFRYRLGVMITSCGLRMDHTICLLSDVEEYCILVTGKDDERRNDLNESNAQFNQEWR